MAQKLIDLTGKKFGKLSVIKHFKKTKDGAHLWLCKCECGKKRIVRGYSLRKGITVSCGCFAKEKSRHIQTKHGFSRTNLYKRWSSILDRCYRPSKLKYKNYGKRGIKVCKEWSDDFMSFRNWAMSNGYKKGLTIDRIDVNGDYCPENCRWVDKKTQARNRRNNIFYLLNKKKVTLSQLLKEIKYTESLYYSHLKSGKKDIKDIFEGIDFDNFKIERVN